MTVGADERDSAASAIEAAGGGWGYDEHHWERGCRRSASTPIEDEASRIGEYLASHGGPFFELQRRLGVLREDALLAGRRAAIFVALAWGVPLS